MGLIFDISTVTEINTEIFRGDDEVWVVVLNQKNGDPADITIADSIFFTVRTKVDGDELFNYSKGSGIEITDGPNGEFEITHLSAKTVSEVPGIYEYDIEYSDPTNGKRTVARGKFKIKGDITI